MGAQTVVRFAFNVWDDKEILLDVGYWNTTNEEVRPSMTHIGEFENMLTMQSEAILALARRLKLPINSETRKLIMLQPTSDLAAFLLYSQGLEKEDQGLHAEALRFFEKAYERDSEFLECRLKIDQNRLLALAQKEPPDHSDLGSLQGNRETIVEPEPVMFD